jgi:hypothetical protein
MCGRCATQREVGSPAGSEHGGRQDTYMYILDSSCGERSLVARFHIEVVDGSVAASPK